MYTLVSTTGSLTGAFGNAANGATITDDCGEQYRIDYHESGSPQTVTATVTSTPTTTSLGALPANPVTNEGVTLTATVTPSSATPAGTVEFDSGGTAIAGCASQPLALSGSSYIATCQTAFTAASSPQFLSATFTPASGSGLVASTSLDDTVTIAADATATTLGISSAAPAIGASVSYTATVTPAHAGPAEPSGTVEFLDGGSAIGACASQPLTAGASSSTATCTLSYPAAGSHSITATYLADANFAGSTSTPAQTVTVPTTGPPTSTSTAPSASTESVSTSQQTTTTSSTTSSTGGSGVAGTKKVVPATKPLTEAQKRARAIKACSKLKKSKRAKCVAAAKKRYPLTKPKAKHKKKK